MLAEAGRVRPIKLPESPGPVSFHLPLIVAVLIQRRLNGSLQPVLVVGVESEELERLKTPCNGVEHFRRAEHRSFACQKHQLHPGALIQGSGQAKQAASHGDDLQFA